MSKLAVRIGLGLFLSFAMFTACQDLERIGVSPEPSSTGPAASTSSHAGAAGAAGSSNPDLPDASNADDARPDVPADVELPDLTVGLPGPKMVRIRAPNGQSYYIDSTEVSQGHYQKFLESVETAGFQPALPSFCDSNTSYRPPLREPGEQFNTFVHCPDGGFTPTDTPDLPMVCVDWCDAQAYCQWAGKRLCGQVGGGGVEVAGTNLVDPNVDQWYNACSNGGKTKFQTGDVFDAAKCNAKNHVPAPAQLDDVLEDVGGSPLCTGAEPPFNRVYDLSGNVGEWEDACAPFPTSPVSYRCQIRGYNGSTQEQDLILACNKGGMLTVSYSTSLDVGIRCCHDGP